MSNDQNIPDIDSRIEMLRKIVIFADSAENTLLRLAKLFKERIYESGQTLFRKGDPSGSLYLIKKGHVRIHDGAHVFGMLEDGDVVGEYSLLDTEPRSASVTTIFRTTVLILDNDDVEALPEIKNELIKGIVKVLTKRLRSHNTLEEKLTESNLQIRKQNAIIEEEKKTIEKQNEEIRAHRDEIMQQRDKVMEEKKNVDLKNIEILQKNEEISAQRDELEKHKILLEEEKRIIELQNKEIQEHQKKIEASINYAKRIQTAMLPPENYVNKHFPDHFILYLPRDIVSGDFYWAKEVGNKLIIVCADCTGHGVPGAFMSMLGIALLNEIVNKLISSKTLDTIANEILNELRINLIRSLHQENHTRFGMDGMDISLVIMDHEHKEIQFSGARNSLYIVRDSRMMITKANTMPIGVYHTKTIKPFTNHIIQLKRGDVLYMFSDGFMDQFGGEKIEKYEIKRLKEKLLEIHNEATDFQKAELNQTFLNWKGDLPQMDDIVLIGMKIE